MTSDTQKSEIKAKVEALNKKHEEARETLKADRANTVAAQRLFNAGHTKIDVESIAEKAVKAKEQVSKIRKQMSVLRKEFLKEALAEWNEITGQGRKKKEKKA